MHGPKQTVPRAGLGAFFDVLRLTDGDIAICSGCKHVVAIFNKGAATTNATLENNDLWSKLEIVLDDRSGSVSVDGALSGLVGLKSPKFCSHKASQQPRLKLRFRHGC